MKHPEITITIGILLAFQMTVLAQPKLVLEIQERKINLSEQEAAGDADIVYAPGDTLEFTILAQNTGDADMVNPEIVDPIPKGLVYVANSAKGENCQIFFSISDGFQYSEWPIMIKLENPQGAQVGQEAGPDQVTHIKWMVRGTVPAGEMKQLTFQAIVQ